MTEHTQNLLTAEKLDALEAELKAVLPALYKDDGERQIVSEILIPQFKAKLNETLDTFGLITKSDQIIIPSKIQEICRAVDRILSENEDILDTKGLFLPVLGKIYEVRLRIKAELEEEFKKHCRKILLQKGISDKQSLQRKGLVWFTKEEFNGYGKGKKFAITILGETFEIVTIEILNKIADRLELPEISEATQQKFKAILAAKGVIDRQTLLLKGPDWFRFEEFPGYGKGLAFSTAILGMMERITRNSLDKIADKLEFPEIGEEEKIQHYKIILAMKGITDRPTLLAKGPIWFAKEDFPPYGKGKAFILMILEKETFEHVTIEILNKVADKLGFSKVAESEKIDQFKIMLAGKGIIDYSSFMAKGSEWFKVEEFSGYGKGTAFVSAILGKSCGRITLPVLAEAANKLFSEEV